MIKAIIFDCFGVLSTDGWRQLREEFFADNQEKMQQALDLDKAVNTGVMDYVSFIREVGHLSGLSEQEVQRRMNTNVPNRLLFEYIRSDLKPGYKIGLLSNAAENWLGELFEGWQNDLFDQVILSYQVGMVKPEAQIYELTASNLGVKPEECLFIDDIERFCTAAEELGMKSILHTDSYETIAKIKEILRAGTA
jgi:epoxide hydrolase-like predicted phosphatase